MNIFEEFFNELNEDFEEEREVFDIESAEEAVKEELSRIEDEYREKFLEYKNSVQGYILNTEVISEIVAVYNFLKKSIKTKYEKLTISERDGFDGKFVLISLEKPSIDLDVNIIRIFLALLKSNSKVEISFSPNEVNSNIILNFYWFNYVTPIKKTN